MREVRKPGDTAAAKALGTWSELPEPWPEGDDEGYTAEHDLTDDGESHHRITYTAPDGRVVVSSLGNDGHYRVRLTRDGVTTTVYEHDMRSLV